MKLASIYDADYGRPTVRSSRPAYEPELGFFGNLLAFLLAISFVVAIAGLFLAQH